MPHILSQTDLEIQGSFTRDSNSFELPWSDSQSGQASIAPPDSLMAESIIRKCVAVVLRDEYVARPGGFVICQSEPGLLWVGRIEEILADTFAGTLLGILIQPYDVQDHVLPYHFPRLRQSPHGPTFCLLKVCGMENGLRSLTINNAL